jgi:predicted NAD-dependent protein-ADP-ribosyltransferase YbiA (DUF1768 family)
MVAATVVMMVAATRVAARAAAVGRRVESAVKAGWKALAPVQVKAVQVV